MPSFAEMSGVGGGGGSCPGAFHTGVGGFRGVGGSAADDTDTATGAADIAAGGNSGPERVGRAGASGDFRFAETVARDTALAAGPRNSGEGFFTFFTSLAFFVVFVVFAFFGAVGAAAVNCSLCKCSVAFLRDAAETTSLRDAGAPAGAVVALTALRDDRGTLAE